MFSSIGTSFSLLLIPKISVILFLKFPGFTLWISFPLCVNANPISVWARTTLSNSFLMCENSAVSDFKNVRRAGTLKNIFLTSILVPLSQIHSSFLVGVPPFISISVPVSVCSFVLVLSVTCAMDAIEAKASPLKPFVFSLKRSSTSLSLLVACRVKQIEASLLDIPLPSS